MRRFFRLWGLAGRDIRVLMTILCSTNRPAWLLPALIVLIVFALDPLNLTIPVLGVIDDFVLLPLLIHALANLAAISATRFNVHHNDDPVVSIQ